MKFEIYADEVRREGMLEYLKTHRTKLTKKQIFDLTWSYMYENYMLNGHTHAVVVNKALKGYPKARDEETDTD